MRLSLSRRIHYFNLRPAPRWPVFLSWQRGATLRLHRRAVCSSTKISSSLVLQKSHWEGFMWSPLFIKSCFHVTEARKWILICLNYTMPHGTEWQFRANWRSLLSPSPWGDKPSALFCPWKVRCIIILTNMARSKWSTHIFRELNFLIK